VKIDHGWERESRNWIAWARTPLHDAYWAYALRFFEDIVPAPQRATLEIGCGEGRVTRDLVARGHRVTGVDAAPSLLKAACELDARSDYVLADAARLPFATGRFDLAVAYNSLMDIEDMPGAVREAARVLADGARLCVCVTHPFADAGKFESRDPDARFVVADSYLESRRYEENFERDGLAITFRGWRHSLATYSSALASAGFVVETLLEPSATESDPESSKERWRRMPMFLFLRARKT
jgi:SAM-dependent methyltransferase